MTTPLDVLEAARIQAGMSFDDLWVAYFSLGGCAQPEVVRSYLAGGAAPHVEHDVLAHAINERFAEQGHNHPVPYLADHS